MNILLIHQAFVSVHEAGGTRHYELGMRLKEAGDKLTVVASQVSYQSGKRVHSDRNAFVYCEDMDGIQVLRAYTLSVLHRSFVWRVLSFVVFALSSVWAGLRVGNIDLVMGTSPPLFQGFSAWFLAFLRRKPFLLEIRDLWPEFAIDMGVLRNPLLIALARWGENFLYARATHLMVNSPAYRDYLLNKGLLEKKISFVANGVEVEAFNPDARGADTRQFFGLTDKFVVVYAGAHGPANDLDTVLRAANHLREHTIIHFLMVGDGKDRVSLEAEAKRLRLNNITFAGALPKTQMPDVLAAADVCLAILKNIPMFSTTYPNKVFDYMAAGRPTVLVIDGVIREVIEKANGGIFVKPGDDEALAVAVEKLCSDKMLRDQMGLSARHYVVAHFNREQQAQEFRKVLEQVSKNHIIRPHQFIKRSIDIIAACAGLTLGSPLMLVIYFVIRSTRGLPVFFRQQRPGLCGKPFTMYKFRTMSGERDENDNLLPDAQRLTRFGEFLRRTSLDELPELFNVLKGDMSLVGPRPLLMQYLDRYTPEQARRHEVRPGITGWAQINGRNALSWEEKFKLDVWYVDHHSLWLDVKIIVMTVWKVLKREGISQEGQATMSEFMGDI